MNFKFSVNEIFSSIQGEGSFSGYPCTFIRLRGCNLRCNWCDTTYSFYEGEKQNLESVLEKTDFFGNQVVEITGGEPMLHKNIDLLFNALHKAGYQVLLETSGSIFLDKVPKYVHTIMDWKPPGSGESKKNHPENPKLLKPSDDVKFVLTDHDDFLWSIDEIDKNFSWMKTPPILQPVFGRLEPNTLAKWILNSGRNLRLGIQLHKILFDPEERGV